VGDVEVPLWGDELELGLAVPAGAEPAGEVLCDISGAASAAISKAEFSEAVGPGPEFLLPQ